MLAVLKTVEARFGAIVVDEVGVGGCVTDHRDESLAMRRRGDGAYVQVARLTSQQWRV
jgi:hypothetical protein